MHMITRGKAGEIRNVAVVGSGTMGSGIAHVFAQYGFNVALNDVKSEFIDRGLQAIGKNLDRWVKKGSINEEEKARTLSRIRGEQSLQRASQDADLVIEAATEDAQIKKSIFSTLDSTCKSHAIFASNTSSISITELASATKRPDRCIGMHFMNPVPVMKLVEIVRGYGTSPETAETVRTVAEKLQKVPVEVNDFPGFVSNRILLPMINEAIYCVMEGVARPEAIDTVMKLGMNHPMGPLALADFIGLDVCLAILEVLHRGLGDDKYRPCPLLRTMVSAGHLGRKTNKGFFDYGQS